MAPRRAPNAQTPSCKFSSSGRITNWSKEWDEAKQLELLVSQGLIPKEWTASQVMRKYPNFEKFTCKALASALANCRKKHFKEVMDRSSHVPGVECEFDCCIVVFLPSLLPSLL